MEQRLAQFLRRIGQADRSLREGGKDPDQFMLIHTGGMTIRVVHPGWDNSWPSPTHQDIDDLGDLAFLRVQPSDNKQRNFDLTPRGREQAAILDQPQRIFVGGEAPPVDAVLDWLVEGEQRLGSAFHNPADLLDEAAAAGLIDPQGREVFAARIASLHRAGYLEGDLPDFQQATAETRLSMSEGLTLSMKAHDRARSDSTSQPSNTVNVYGSVIASQIATGNIENFVSFEEVLERAEAAIANLTEVDDSARDEAFSLIETLRGRALSAGGPVMTGAGGGLLAEVIAKLVGLA